MNPTPLGPTQLQLNRWVYVDGHAYRIVNLRTVGVGGRLVELACHTPVYVHSGQTLTGFDVARTLAEDVPDVPAPARSKRRRATPGVGQTAPGPG